MYVSSQRSSYSKKGNRSSEMMASWVEGFQRKYWEKSFNELVEVKARQQASHS